MSHFSAELTSETKPGALPKTSRSSHRFLWLLLGGTILIGLVLVATRWPHYAGTSVCQTCGIRRDYFDWELRVPKITLHRFHRENPTAVSRALAERAPAPQHTHNWTDPVDVSVSDGAGARDETSPHLLYSVEAPRVARFASNLALYGNPDTLEKWRRIILNPRYSIVLGPSLRFMRFPEEGFSEAAAFRDWWRAKEYPLGNRLRELTEPD